MKEKLHRLVLYAATLTIGVFFYSCENDLDTNLNQQPLSNIIGQQQVTGVGISLIQQEFIDQSYDTKLASNFNDTIKIHWEPNWNVASQQVIKDTITYTYIPLNPTLRAIRSREIVGTFNDNDAKDYLMVKSYGSLNEFYKATYIFDKVSTENDIKQKELSQSKDLKSFSGSLFLMNLGHNVTTKVLYKNGARQKTPNDGAKTGEVSANGYYTVCNVENECIWSRLCYYGAASGIEVQGARTFSTGPCVQPGPGISAGCEAWRLTNQFAKVVCTEYYDPNIPTTPPTDPYIPPTTSGGSSGSGTSTYSSRIADNFNSKIYLFNGVKPAREYSNSCQGAVGLWNTSLSFNPPREAVGVITTDGKLLEVAVLGVSGGTWGGLYYHEGNVYYTYPMSQGAPSQTYTNMLTANGQYFIPIKATIHTHSPCVQDGTNGISNLVISQGDKALATKFPMIKHYIIGCNAVGLFNLNSTSPTLLQSGPLSNTCNVF